jgi:hypothetical protein
LLKVLKFPTTNKNQSDQSTLNPTFSEMQAGVLGGHLRVASIGAYDVDSQLGFEMMALGPLALDNDTVLVAIRPHTPTNQQKDGAASTRNIVAVKIDRAATAADGTIVDEEDVRVSDAVTSPYTFLYYSVSLDRTHSEDSQIVPSAVFYLAVLEHAVEWNDLFAPAMEVMLPYAERRQSDMAKGVLVSTSTVFIGDIPNYGTVRIFGRNLHSRMPLDPTHVRLKRTYV